MSVFTSTYSYPAGVYIKAKVESRNTIGWGPISEANIDSVIAKTVPNAPIGLSATSLTVTSVRLSWDKITSSAQSGYQTVTDYKVLSNGGSGTTFTVLKSTTGNANTIDLTGLTSGATYIFKVLGLNKFGDGVESVEVSILVALQPGQMGIITTTEVEVIPSNTKNVVFSWSLPVENGDPINQYRVLFYSKLSTSYSELTALCDGSTSSVVTNRQCSIDIAEFRDSSFGYSNGDLIIAKISAHNGKGWGPESDPNDSGIVLQSAPISEPANFEVVVLDPTTVTLSWDSLSTEQAGYSSITSYSILWDNGDGSSLSVKETTTDTSISINLLTTGNEYEFSVRADNIYGSSSNAASKTILVATAPNAPSVMVSQSGTNVIVSWNTPTNNGAVISGYTIYLKEGSGGSFVDRTSD